jgi:type IV secretion system protein VirD4
VKRLLYATPAIPIVAYAWLAAASAIYLSVAQRWDLYVFPYTQWLQAAPWWRYRPMVTAMVVGSAAAPTLFLLAIAVLAFRAPRRKLAAPLGGGLKPLERGVTDNHGHARWATEKELLNRFGKRGGLLIGAVERGGALLHHPCDDGPTHSLIFAGPGSFKSTSAITRIRNWDGPVVVFDPSCEMGPIMTNAMEEKHYRVTTVAPGAAGIDALDWINPKHPEAEVHIRTAVEAIYDEKAGAKGEAAKDPFWSTWGKSLVACLMAHMLYSDYPEKNLATLREGISLPEDQLQQYLKDIHANSNSRMARDLSGGLMGMRAAETFSGIYSNAFSATEWLSVESYANMLSRPSIKASDITLPDSCVFIQTKLKTLEATPAIGRAIMSSLLNALHQADGAVEKRILFLIDEAALLGKMREIMLGYTTGRKYGAVMQTLWQSEGQMEGVWGKDDAKALRDSSSWRAYGAVQDPDVAETLSKALGEYGVMAYSEGDNTGSQRQGMIGNGSRSKGRNASKHEIKRRLITATEITCAPPDEMFVKLRGEPHPIRCYAAPYFKYPEIAREMDANRFARVRA